MKTILTNDCDIDITNGKMSYITDDKRLAQNINNRLSINANEWFLNLELGLDYSKIQGKGVSDSDVAQALNDCLKQDTEIESTNLIGFSTDGCRHATIEFTYTPTDKEPEYMKEVIDFE